MRTFGQGETPLEILDEDADHYQVGVPGFGVVIIGTAKSQEQIVRLGNPEHLALLVQPDAAGGFSRDSNQVTRKVDVVDDRLEVELLPNSSGEPRLTVVVVP